MRRELEGGGSGGGTSTSNPLGPGTGALKIRNLSQSNRALQDEAAAKAAQAEKAMAELANFKRAAATAAQQSAAEKGAMLAATAKAPKRDGFAPVASK